MSGREGVSLRGKITTTQGGAPMKKYIVKLTQEERADLQKLIGQGEAPARKLMHARILLKADTGEAGPGWSDQAISEALEVGTATVERVRERLVEERLGARLVLTTNTSGHMSEFYEVFRQTLLELQKPAYLERLQAHEAHRGTKESLSDMLQAAGFRVVKIREDRFHFRYLDGSALFNHFLTQFGFLDGWRRVIDQEDEERVFMLIENRLNQIASASGELCMTVPMLYLEGEKPD